MLSASVSWLFASCTPVESNQPTTAPDLAPITSNQPAPSPPSTPEPSTRKKTKTLALKTTEPSLKNLAHQGVTLTLVTFDSRSHQLIVADQEKGPGTQWPTARQAAQKHQGLAAINGGFFTETGAPLGLVIENGHPIGKLNRASSLGTGFYLQPRREAQPLIGRRGQPAVTRHLGQAWQLLQSGPMLLENRKIIKGLSQENPRIRSFLLWDGQHTWAIGQSNPTSLHDLATAIHALSTPELKWIMALNLDGGRSSDLWISPQIQGGPRELRMFWNKPVRNFLILQKRH